MVRASRTFRTESGKVVIDGLDECNVYDNSKKGIVKSSAIKWQVLFDDDKLKNMYYMVKVTNNFLGFMQIDPDPINSLYPTNYLFNNTIGEQSLNIIFNSAWTIINYMKRRNFSEEHIKKILDIKPSISNRFVSSITYIIDMYKKAKTYNIAKSSAYALPTITGHQAKMIKNFEFAHKVSQEFSALERVGELNSMHLYLMYELISLYLYDRFTGTAETMKTEVTCSYIGDPLEDKI